MGKSRQVKSKLLPAGLGKSKQVSASVGGESKSTNPRDWQLGQERLGKSSLGKQAAMGNPLMQATRIGSWARRQVGCDSKFRNPGYWQLGQISLSKPGQVDGDGKSQNQGHEQLARRVWTSLGV